MTALCRDPCRLSLPQHCGERLKRLVTPGSEGSGFYICLFYQLLLFWHLFWKWLRKCHKRQGRGNSACLQLTRMNWFQIVARTALPPRLTASVGGRCHHGFSKSIVNKARASQMTGIFFGHCTCRHDRDAIVDWQTVPVHSTHMLWMCLSIRNVSSVLDCLGKELEKEATNQNEDPAFEHIVLPWGFRPPSGQFWPAPVVPIHGFLSVRKKLIFKQHRLKPGREVTGDIFTYTYYVYICMWILCEGLMQGRLTGSASRCKLTYLYCLTASPTVNVHLSPYLCCTLSYWGTTGYSTYYYMVFSLFVVENYILVYFTS